MSASSIYVFCVFFLYIRHRKRREILSPPLRPSPHQSNSIYSIYDGNCDLYYMVKLRFDLRSCGVLPLHKLRFTERERNTYTIIDNARRQGIDKLLYQMNIKENTIEWFSHEDDYFLM